MVSSDAWTSLRTGPERIGSYIVEKELGRGCYGVVYLVRREGLERRFALKVLTAEALRSPETVARFQREAKVASRIQDPGIVAIHDLGQEGRFPYYVMDVVRGPTLQDMIRKGAFPANQAAELVSALAKTMDAAHRAQVIHRDLKPANVIIDEATQRPRVTDFGLAQEQGGMRLTRTGEAVGTPFYMAPEQNLGQRDLDARVDIYALGVILYECLTGQVPYQGANFIEISHAIRRGQPTPPQTLVPGLPKALITICLKAMATDRDARYQTSGAFGAALQGFLDANRPAPSAGPGTAPARRSGPSLAALAGAAAVFLVLGIGGASGWLIFQRRRDRQAASLLAEAQAATSEKEAQERLAKLAALGPRAEVAAGAALERARWEARGEIAEALPKARGEALTQLLVRAKEQRLLPALASERSAAALALLREATTLDLATAALTLEDAKRLASDLPALAGDISRALLKLRLKRAAKSGQDPAILEALLDEVAADPDTVGLPEVRQVRLRHARLSYLALARAGQPLAKLLEALDASEFDSEGEAALGVLRAEAYRRRGRYKLALREANRWSSADDKEVAGQAGFIKSFALLRLERHAEAMQCFELVSGRYAGTAVGFLAQAHQAVLARGSARAGVDGMQTYTARHPDDPDGWVLLGASLGRLGRHEESARALETAIEIAPDHPRPQLMKGVTLAERRQWQESRRALEAAEKLCEAGPFPMLLRVRIQVYIQLRAHPEALKDAEAFVKLSPNDATAYVHRSVTRWYSGQQKGALEDLRRALGINREAAYAAAQSFGPQVVGALRQAEAGAKPGGGTGAQAQPGALQVSRPSPPPKAGGGLDEARAAALAGGALEKVLPLYDRALKGAKQAAFREFVTVERLEFLHRRGRYAQVLEGGKPFAQSKTPLGLRVRWVHAMSLLWMGRTDAMNALATLARADPQGAIGLTASATWHSHQRKNQDGVRLAVEAIKRNPSFPDAYLSLAFCLHDLGRVREAAGVLQQVGPLLNDHPRYHKALAFVATSTGQAEGAVQSYTNVITLTQPEPYLEAVRSRGWLLYSLRRPKQALADAEHVVRRSPQDIYYFWLTGLCKYELGEVEAAVAIWKRCQAASPQAVPELLRQTPVPKTQAAAAKALGVRLERRPQTPPR